MLSFAMQRRGPFFFVRHGAALGSVALFACALLGGAAFAFDPDALSEGDRSVISTLLEYDRTNASRELPSGGTVTVRQTQTRPQICRFFVIERSGGGAEEGVGCRVGTQQWALSDGLPDPEPETVPALVEAPEERPGPPRRDEGPSRAISVPETVTATAADLTADSVPRPPSREVALAPPGADAADGDAENGAETEIASAPFTPPTPPVRPGTSAPAAPADAPIVVAEATDSSPPPEAATDTAADDAPAEGQAVNPGLPMLAGTPVPVPPVRSDGAEDVPATEVAALPPPEAATAPEADAPVAEPPVAETPIDDAADDAAGAEEPAVAVVALPETAALSEATGSPLAEAADATPTDGLTEADRALAPFQAAPPPPAPGAVVPEGASEIVIVTDGTDAPATPERSDGFEALLSRLTGAPAPDPVDETAPPIVAAESVLREPFSAPVPPRRPAPPPQAESPAPAAGPAVATSGFPLPPVRPGRG